MTDKQKKWFKDQLHSQWLPYAAGGVAALGGASLIGRKVTPYLKKEGVLAHGKFRRAFAMGNSALRRSREITDQMANLDAADPALIKLSHKAERYNRAAAKFRAITEKNRNIAMDKFKLRKMAVQARKGLHFSAAGFLGAAAASMVKPPRLAAAFSAPPPKPKPPSPKPPEPPQQGTISVAEMLRRQRGRKARQ